MRPHDMLRLATGDGLRHEVRPRLGAHVACSGGLCRRAPCTCSGWAHPCWGAREHRAGPSPPCWRWTPSPHALPRRISSAEAGATWFARWMGPIQVLDAVDELFAALGLVGPTGSVGFELATGVAAASTASDLDVVVRVPEPWPLEMHGR